MTTTPSPPATDPEAEARHDARRAGLHYVTNARPGITRVRSGKGFRYIRPDGSEVTDSVDQIRIKHLAVPPAWEDVWICPDPLGHIQATGRDRRGRKQYRYHERWREVRDALKYDHMIEFGSVLPKIRARVDEDLARAGLPRERVLAAVVRLLDIAMIRVGNQEYARDNRSYGLTTLRRRHLDVEGTQLRFEFPGKSGVRHSVRLRDRRLAAVLARCQDLPGQELFQYVDEQGERQRIESEDVNAYLREAAGADVTAKDFRTWAGTVLAACALREAGPAAGEREARRQVVEAIAAVAGRLGNTPAVCRRCYVHPDVLEAHADGSLLELRVASARTAGSRLRPEERAVLRLLRATASRRHRRAGMRRAS